MSKQGKKVLVVEDEESFITALQVGLTREGFEVVVVDDGAKALDELATNNRFDPDIVLLDLMLPNRSGIDICKDIRTVSKTPVIMVTAKRRNRHSHRVRNRSRRLHTQALSPA